MSDHVIRVLSVYLDSCAASTRSLYEDLQRCGPAGALAVNLLRACKKSERAKDYRGRGARSFKIASYEGKEWAVANVCVLLTANHDLVKSWGWGTDDKQPVHKHVLYVDLPTGQVSFHTGARWIGPDYQGQWNCRGYKASAQAACSYAASLLATAVAA